LLNVKAIGSFASKVQGFELVHRQSGQRYQVLSDGSDFKVLKLKAGTYKLGSMMVSSGAKALKGADRVKSIHVKPQTITYIGDWTLAYGQAFDLAGSRIRLDDATYRVSYDPQMLARFGEGLTYISEYAPVVAAANGNRLQAKWTFSSNGAIAGIQY
jgi:hypothetical protein